MPLKIRTTIQMFRRFLLTADPARRHLFLEMIKLVGQKVVAPDRVVLMLMNIEAGAAYLKHSEREYRRVRAAVAAVDRGPWAVNART